LGRQKIVANCLELPLLLLLQAATPLSAMFSFFVRDLAGMLGGILFASYQGSGLDSYAKQWRIFADCLNDLGECLKCRAHYVWACLGRPLSVLCF
jgi:hypothetical protein